MNDDNLKPEESPGEERETKEIFNPEDPWKAANIAPSDLYYTEFRRVVLGGYDREEVDTFRDHVADLFEALLQQLRDLKIKSAAQEKEIASFHEMEDALRNALKSSQKFSETMLENARREADALLAEASLARARAESQARELPDHLRDEVRELEAERARLRADLSAVLQAHQAMIAHIPSGEARVDTAPLPPPPKARVSRRGKGFKFAGSERLEVVPMTEDPVPESGAAPDNTGQEGGVEE